MVPLGELPRIDTLELKEQIFRKLGQKKAKSYFCNLSRLLSRNINKSEFDKSCCNLIGRENVALHNSFIRSILSNACFAHRPPPSRQAAMGQSRYSRMPTGNLEDLLPVSPRRGRSVTSRYRRVGDRPSPLGPNGKVPPGNVLEASKPCSPHKSRVPEMASHGNKAPLEVISDGEEVEQARYSPVVQSRSTVRPRFDTLMSAGGFPQRALRKAPSAGFHLCRSMIPERCSGSSELPDTRSLLKRLESKLELEGLGISLDCANLLNNGLDVYLKRMIKPCLDLAKSRCNNEIMSRADGRYDQDMNGMRHVEHSQRSNQGYTASMLDFQVAMEVEPQLLGVDWSVQRERISLRPLEE